MIRFNANLFRIAFQCASSDETRFYLNGVYVEPHHTKGVQLVATDGNQMIVIHDETGSADESAIINLRDGLRACKPKRGERRDVIIHTGESDATVCVTAEQHAGTFTDTALTKAFNVRIDGSFPAYRRVVPATFMDKASLAFAAELVAQISAVGLDLVAHFHDWKPRKHFEKNKRLDAFKICAANCDVPDQSPALILWPCIPQAFAVLMPYQAELKTLAPPAWFDPSAAQSAA